MKKKLVLFFAGILLVSMTGCGSSQVSRTNQISVLSATTGQQPESQSASKNDLTDLYQEMLVTALDPYIQKSVAEYYNCKYVMAPPYVVKVMEAKRPSVDQMYELKLEAEPYIGPHDQVGIDRLTMAISPTEINIISFQHLKSFSLPPSLQPLLR
jgi:hypothetical protein